jgi:HAMP domain-containing protein
MLIYLQKLGRLSLNKAKNSRGSMKSWIGRFVFESALIMFSILCALAINSWHTDQENKNLVHQSLLTFQREVGYNQQWVESSYPYILGVRDVIVSTQQNNHPLGIEDFQQMIGSIQLALLRKSTWDTAVSAGVLTHMNFELVAALSLTYGLQERVETIHNDGLSEVVKNTYEMAENTRALNYSSVRYLNSILEAESELKAAYDQVNEILQLQIEINSNN